MSKNALCNTFEIVLGTFAIVSGTFGRFHRNKQHNNNAKLGLIAMIRHILNFKDKEIKTIEGKNAKRSS